MALTEGRNTAEIANGARTVVLPVAKTIIYGGAMVALDASGNAVPAKKAADTIVVGRAEETVDNSAGAAGDLTIKVKRGVFIFDNDPASANKVTQAHVFKDCYVIDDCTVTSLATGSSVAGKVISVSADGVAVEII